MGLNKSVPEQSGIYVSDLVRGDFGRRGRTRAVSDGSASDARRSSGPLRHPPSILLAILIGVSAASDCRFDRVLPLGGGGRTRHAIVLARAAAGPRLLHQPKIAPALFGRLASQRADTTSRDRSHTVDALIAEEAEHVFNALGHLILPAISWGRR